MKNLLYICLLLSTYSFAQSHIHVDQFGYELSAEKVAVLSNPQIGYNSGDSYTPSAQLDVIDANTGNVALSVSPQDWNSGGIHATSGDIGWWLDFSALTTPGDYYIEDATSGEQSATFTISEFPYNEVFKQAARTFFYNRCNYEKAAPYADANWTDGTNFLNPLQDANCYYIHDSLNSALEKDLSGGWFDAGDYNKYVTFAHSAVHDLLSAYEENPQAFGDNWNIPESGNGLPDVLDEVKWELDWLLKMNNTDGSTHIKMGSTDHSSNVAAPPSANFDPRFYGPTCSSASLAVASMFAHAARIFGQFSGYETFTNTLETRAIAAWSYVLPLINSGQLETECDLGEIIAGDADWDIDRQLQAAVTASAHLFALTGDNAYHTYFQNNYATTEPVSSAFWAAYKSVLNTALLHYTTLPNRDATVAANIISALETDASNNWNGYYGFNDADLYRAFMPSWSYHWGSNSPKAGYGSLNQLLIQHNILPANHDSYRKHMKEIIHYFHGVNPQDVVYLSNMYAYGADRSCNEIYHTWFADGSDWDNALTSLYGPAPGFVPGGPNPSFSVGSISPPSNQPEQKSYLDFNSDWPDNSWEITEPAIYYQAAYIRLLANFVDESGSSQTGNIAATPSSIEIFPNPINNYFVIKGDLIDYNIDLLNEIGQVVSNLNTSGTEVTVDTSTLGAGLFFIRLQHKATNALSVQKIIKGL